MVPELPAKKIIRSFAGVRPRLLPNSHSTTVPKTPKTYGDFCIRHSQTCSELIGIASPGLSSALPIAEELSAHIIAVRSSRGLKTARKHSFITERKAYIPSQREKYFFKGQELHKLVQLELTAADCLVCRCEQVSSSTIQQALNRDQPVHSLAQNLDSLKWRTRAGMGSCQGQFCAPRLKSLLQMLKAGTAGHDLEIVDYAGNTPERVSPQELRKALGKL